MIESFLGYSFIVLFQSSQLITQCGLEAKQGEWFHDSLIGFVSKFEEKKVAIIAREDNEHIGGRVEYFENQHGGYDFGVRNKEAERILEFCVAIKMTVGNTFFKERKSHQVAWGWSTQKTDIV